MTPYYQDPLVTLLQGDVREALASLPEGSVHAVITSPPYWALRDYKVDGQIGMEPTIEEYVAHMVEVFRAVRRVLRDDGVCFINLGDSYNANTGSGFNGQKRYDDATRNTRLPQPKGIKSLDLCNIPHRVAQALQADGWYWRQTWHWIKRSPMPESVSGTRWQRCRVKTGGKWGRTFIDNVGYVKHGDTLMDQPQTQWAACPGCPRCTYPERPERNGWVLRHGSWRYTDAVEYVFLLCKQPGYTAFQTQVREEHSPSTVERWAGVDGGGKRVKDYSLQSDALGVFNNGESYHLGNGRNPRNWALLSSEPQSVAHFATYPTALVEPFIRAATSDKGVCATCGAQWVPVVESSTGGSIGQSWHDHSDDNGQGQAQKHAGEALYKTYEPSTVLDYWPSCDHTGAPVPAVVLDPFGGTMTTCLAARTLGRRSIGIDLSTDYLGIAVRRLGDERKAQMELL